ncbi:MAG: hypothetical protein U0176_04890 [Bacteroidia bacterium]
MMGWAASVAGQVGQALSNYSHWRRQWCANYFYHDPSSIPTAAMGKDRWMASSVTGFNSADNYLVDSVFNPKLHFQPDISPTPTNQNVVISSSKQLWYAGDFGSQVRCTRMTEQGTVLNQFAISGYSLAGMYADTLGKVFLFLKDANGVGMLRFDNAGTLDFGKWVNGSMATHVKPVRYGVDGKFYLMLSTGLLAMDRNGNVGRFTDAPAGWEEGPVYPDGDRSMFRRVAGPRIQVARLDSFMVPRWAVEFDFSLPNSTDSLLSALDAVMVRHSQEIFLVGSISRKMSVVGQPCAAVQNGYVLRDYVVRPDGSLGGSKNYDPVFQKGVNLPALFTSPYGEPIGVALDRGCTFGALSPPSVSFNQFDPISGSAWTKRQQ